MADATVSTAGMRIVKLLVGKPPQTVADLMEAAGVTRTAVAEQLRELEQAGLVQSSVERTQERGRPRNRFQATEAALLLLSAGKESVIGHAVWDSLQEVGGNPLVEKILERVSQELAEHYRSRVTAKTPAGRLRQMNRLLQGEGILVELVETSDRVALHKRSCAFISMFDENQRVCHIDERILSLIVGQTVHRTACRHDGDACCVFEISKKGG